MSNIRELRQRRAALAANMRNRLDHNPQGKWTDEHTRDHDRDMLELDDLDSKLAVHQRFEDGAHARAHGIEETELEVFLRNGLDGLSPERLQAIHNTMSTTTASQGGYTVASDVASRFVDTVKDFSGVRRVAEVFKTVKGNTMPWPTSDGTAETGELVAENATAAAADPTFGTAPLPTYKYSSRIFAVPFELLRDSAIDIEQFVFDRAASRIGRITNTQFTVGTGSGQPQGFVGAATSGKVGTTGQTLTVIHDDLIDLVHAVNAGYRQDPRGGVCFQMADVTFKVVRKLKDSSNRPIYLPSDGVSAEAIMGYPVIVNDDVPVPAANAKSIHFGNFRLGYKVRDVLEVSVFRFDDSAYTKLGQVAFLAFARCGGNLVDTAAVKFYQHSAT